jgi:hypothetical protein
MMTESESPPGKMKIGPGAREGERVAQFLGDSGGSEAETSGVLAGERAVDGDAAESGGLDVGPLAIGYRPEAIGYRLEAIGYRLSAIGGEEPDPGERRIDFEPRNIDTPRLMAHGSRLGRQRHLPGAHMPPIPVKQPHPDPFLRPAGLADPPARWAG